MTRGYLQAEVDKIRIVDKFTTILDGKYLQEKLAAQQAADAPSQGTRLAAQKHPAKKSSQKAPLRKGKELLKLRYQKMMLHGLEGAWPLQTHLTCQI